MKQFSVNGWTLHTRTTRSSTQSPHFNRKAFWTTKAEESRLRQGTKMITLIHNELHNPEKIYIFNSPPPGEERSRCSFAHLSELFHMHKTNRGRDKMVKRKLLPLPAKAEKEKKTEKTELPGCDILLTWVIYMWVMLCMIYAKLTAITSTGPRLRV